MNYVHNVGHGAKGVAFFQNVLCEFDLLLANNKSRPPPIQKLGAENHMLQLSIQCS